MWEKLGITRNGNRLVLHHHDEPGSCSRGSLGRWCHTAQNVACQTLLAKARRRVGSGKEHCRLAFGRLGSRSDAGRDAFGWLVFGRWMSSEASVQAFGTSWHRGTVPNCSPLVFGTCGSRDREIAFEMENQMRLQSPGAFVDDAAEHDVWESDRPCEVHGYGKAGPSCARLGEAIGNQRIPQGTRPCKDWCCGHQEGFGKAYSWIWSTCQAIRRPRTMKARLVC